MRRMSKVWRVFLLAAVMTVLVSGLAAAANSVESVQPENVKFYLYDYWTAGGRNTEDTPTYEGKFSSAGYDHASNYNSGINKGHAMLFLGNNGGLQYGWWNARTAGRLVKPYLVNGYPELDLNRSGHTVIESLAQDSFPEGIKTFKQDLQHNNAAVFGEGASGEENLRYLFDPDYEHEGKVSFPATHLLLKEDAKGRYYFNSVNHFAQLDENSGKFTLYDRTGLPSGAAAYRFFPFNTQQQFYDSWIGSLTQYDMNHFFGLMMEVEFYQTEDGQIQLADGSKEDMVFHFSGDDDVVVFVDNLLVGSVGGIHGRRAIDINFNTGVITQERDGMTTDEDGEEIAKPNNNIPDVANNLNHGDTTIQAYFDMATSASYNQDGSTLLNHEGYDTPLTQEGTLQPYTRHTLRMYYLERGNWDSNMEISFNLFYPYNKFTVENTIVGGNETLRSTDFTYDLGFDMSGIMTGLFTEDAKEFDYEVFAGDGDTAAETGAVTINRITGKITAVAPAGGGASAYLTADSKAKLSDGERVVFNLPDASVVTVTQSNPALTTLQQLGLNADPYELETLTVTPEALKQSAAEPTAKAKAKVMAASSATVVAYRNVIKTGSLKVIKTIDPQDENHLPREDYAFIFDVTVPAIGQVTDKNYPATLTATVKAGETTAETDEIPDIVLGTKVTIYEETEELINDSFLLTDGGGEYPVMAADEILIIGFTNQYAAAVPVLLSGEKTLDGAAPQAEKFAFLIESGAEGTLMPEQTTVFNDEEGRFSFGPIAYDKPGTHTYIISEIWGDDPYIDYDTETRYQAVVTVTPDIFVDPDTDEQSIALEAEAKITKVGDESGADVPIAFANTTRGGVQIKLRKLSSYDEHVLPGAEFTLTHDPKTCPVCLKEEPALMALSLDEEEPTQETESPALNTEEVTTKKAETDQYGAIIFSGLIEGHVYTLEETKAPADHNLPAKRTWTVVNDGSMLMIDNEPLSGALVIRNRPTYWPVEMELHAAKTLGGETPEEKYKFDFAVLDANSNVIREAQNVLGEVVFEPILIEKPGTYRFDIVERLGEHDRIWYDRAVYTVTAEVKAVEVMAESGEGTGDYMLEFASVTYTKDGVPYTGELPVFANLKIPLMPPTGDDSRMGLWLALLGVSAAGALLLLWRRRGRAQ